VHSTGYSETGLYHYDNRIDSRFGAVCDSLSNSRARMRICRRLPYALEQHWPTGTLRYHCCNCCRCRRGNSNTTLQQTNQSPMIRKRTSNSSSLFSQHVKPSPAPEGIPETPLLMRYAHVEIFSLYLPVFLKPSCRLWLVWSQ